MSERAAKYPRVQKLTLSEIVVDPTIQTRENGLSDGTVDEYAESIRDGVTFPPLVVFHNEDENRYWLSEGFHRYAAHEKAERTEVECEVRLGDRLAALYNSCGSNRTHGLPRTNADKRRVIALLLGEYPTQSDRWIANAVGCDHKTVAAVRDPVKKEMKRSNDCTGEFPQCNGQNDPPEPSPVPSDDRPKNEDLGPNTSDRPCEKASASEENGAATNAGSNFIQVEQKSPLAARDRHAGKQPRPSSSPATPTGTELLGPKFKKWLTEAQKLLGELESEKGQAPVQVAAENNDVPVWPGDCGLRWKWIDGMRNVLTELGVKL